MEKQCSGRDTPGALFRKIPEESTQKEMSGFDGTHKNKKIKHNNIDKVI